MFRKLNARPQVCVLSVCFQVPVLGPIPLCSGCRGPIWLDQAVQSVVSDEQRGNTNIVFWELQF